MAWNFLQIENLKDIYTEKFNVSNSRARIHIIRRLIN